MNHLYTVRLGVEIFYELRQRALPTHLYTVWLGVEILCELRQRVLLFQDEVVGVVLVINAADDIEDGAAQVTRRTLQE